MAPSNLDPANWEQLRRQGHLMLDDMLDYIEHIRDRPVWQPMSTAARSHLRSELPVHPTDLARVHQDFLRDVLPYTTGNVHPGFMGWVHGGGTAVGMLAEMLAATLNANCGGRDHAPIEVERQIAEWARGLFGFPDGATGIFVTGTSMANFIALLVARRHALGASVRQAGMGAAGPRLVAYASTGTHACITRAMDYAGLGSEALRLVPVDGQRRMDLLALSEAIATDRQAGHRPFMVIGNAGTVDTGAIDDLASVADIATAERLWFHVDGAFGALGILADDIAPRLRGIERADSLALDFHKWGQVPYDAGFVLVRDGELHRQTFTTSADYLRHAERGLAGGSFWPNDFGPDLSRGFRALKTWFTLRVFGTKQLGAMMSNTCRIARHLEARIAVEPRLELLAPVPLNIVCFRFRGENLTLTDEALDALNTDIAADVQESGVAAPSTTRIDGRVAIRAALLNHRTVESDADTLVSAVLRHGDERIRRASTPTA